MTVNHSTHLTRKAGFSPRTAQTGAVTLVQRFGSALNLNVHFHMLFLDGVYVEHHDGSLRFRWVTAPSSPRAGRTLESWEAGILGSRRPADAPQPGQVSSFPDSRVPRPPPSARIGGGKLRARWDAGTLGGWEAGELASRPAAGGLGDWVAEPLVDFRLCRRLS